MVFNRIVIVLINAGLILTGELFSQNFSPDLIASHPRLLLKQQEEQRIEKAIQVNPYLATIHTTIIQYADKLINEPVLERKVVGRRLLHTSRDAIARIFYLAYSYRLTNDKAYLTRAIAEMRNISSFSDWNPSHFLDTAEMTMALALGYDWLYGELSSADRNLFMDAIIHKGILPSKDTDYFDYYYSHNNWNQVCNGGILFGALAIYEDIPELAQEVINRLLETIYLPLKTYEPDGAYPEGYGYWGYGTGYQVMINAALESVFGSDFGLSEQPGFKESAYFMQYMLGTSGKAFNYSDNRERAESQAVLYWFADKYKDPSMIYLEKDLTVQNSKTAENRRFLPLAMIYGSRLDFTQISAPEEKIWIGEGANPVILIRTDWEKNQGLYVGFKGGSPSCSHGHMDVGSFVFDALGERWAMDMGLQEYHSLESAGVDLWNMRQESERWNIYRYGNEQHNTLTINGKRQSVKGKGYFIDTYTDPIKLGGKLNLSELYAEDVTEAFREVVLIDERYLQISDYINTKSDASVIWTMVTSAIPERIDEKSLKLFQNGKEILFTVTSSSLMDISFAPAISVNDYDAENPGVTLIKIEIRARANQDNYIQVKLHPLLVD